MKNKILKYPFISSIIIGCLLFLFYKIIIGGYISFMFYTGKIQQQSLTLNDFELVGAEQINDMTLINATDDTQIIYEGNAINMYVKCNFSYNPGEFVLFYQNKTNKSFDARKNIHGRIYDGTYKFPLPLNTKSIRLDTGIFSSITVSFEEIIINRKSFKDIFRLETSNIFNLLILIFVIYSITSAINDGFKFSNPFRRDKIKQ